jgi:tetratricopeptide (TPR) repeat protein
VSDEQAQQLLEQGIQAAKNGQKDQARKLLQRSLKLDQHNDSTWLWLASVGRDKRERLLCLQKVLQINPENEMGIKAVKALGVDPEQLVPKKPKGPTFDETQAADDETSEGPGIPLPLPEQLIQAQEASVGIIESYLQEADLENITWTHKEKRRAGEREILMLRVQVGAAVSTIVIFLLAAFVLFIATSPEAQKILLGSSSTPRPPTKTPTNTPTATPGFSTPFPTINFTVEPTFTPSPTPPQSLTPWPTGQRDVIPEPTEIYVPDDPEGNAETAIELLAEGDPNGALRYADFAIDNLGVDFEPSPYYYKAMALLDLGRLDDALLVLELAESRLDNLDGVRSDAVPRFRTLIDLGFAKVNVAQARAAIDNGLGTERTHLSDSRDRTDAIVEVDPLMYEAYIVEADSYALEGSYDSALDVLDGAQERLELITNQALIVARARVLLRRGQELSERDFDNDALVYYNSAYYYSDYAAFISPFSEEAQRIRIEVAMIKDEFGLAALLSKEQYLFYFPNSAEAARNLGVAQMAQGKPDLALEAYTLAVNNEGTDEILALSYVSRAEIYMEQHSYKLALDDLNAAIDLNDKLETHALRIVAAYHAGDFDTAQEDADLLLSTGTITNSEIYLIQARMLVDEGGRARDYNNALDLMNLVGGGLPNELGAVLQEYRARANYELGNFGPALDQIDQAIVAADSGSRHYLRGMVYEEFDDPESAIADYQWVLTWDAVYDFSFVDDAQDRIWKLTETGPYAPPEVTPEPETTAEMTAEPDGEATPTGESGG